MGSAQIPNRQTIEMENMVCECAAEVDKKKYTAFALTSGTNGLECVTAADESNFDDQGEASPNACTNSIGQTCKPNEDQLCAGSKNNMFAYTILTEKHQDVRVSGNVETSSKRKRSAVHKKYRSSNIVYKMKKRLLTRLKRKMLAKRHVSFTS